MIEMLTDADVASRAGAKHAVETMRAAVEAAHRGELQAPPRVAADLGEGRFAFTAGRWRGRWYGYRAYDTFDRAHDDQLVVVHDDATGRLRGLVAGSELGRRRTGALGGVAIDLLAPTAATSLGLVGTGAQAWTQLWAASAVRRFTSVRVFSRNPDRRREFAARATRELGVEAVAAGSARETVEGADVVILATDSAEPVVAAEWLAGTAHVSTVGPRQQGRAEFDESLLDAATVLATDSPAQLRAYDPPALAGRDRHADRVVSLGAIAAGDTPGRRADGDRTVYLSVGLAGTEVALAAALLG